MAKRMTYDEIGALLNVSAQRVRQIERRALQKLARALAKLGVEADDVKAMPTPGDTFKISVDQSAE